jgi:transglutaminase-like putative cysteine protease
MGIQVALNHRTMYRYEKAISLGPQVIQLRPALHCRTPILSYSLDVTPSEHILNWQLDPHNNRLARLLFFREDERISGRCEPRRGSISLQPVRIFLEPGVEEYPFAYAPGLAKDLEPYRSVDPPGPLLHAFLESFVGRKSGTIGLLLDLNRKVRDEIGYVTRLEPGVQTCEETLEKRSGRAAILHGCWFRVSEILASRHGLFRGI